MEYIFLILGFLMLIKGADFFVDGASNLAKAFNVPSILIGLTIVAFGTSAPEVAVSISASLKGNNSIAIGNVLGSNIFNVSFILGISAIFFPLSVQKNTIKKEIPLMLLASISLLVLGMDTMFDNQKQMLISRSDGFMLLLLFLVFFYYIIEIALNSKNEESIEKNVLNKNIFKILIKVAIGLILIILGGNFVVDNSIIIAKNFGLSETLIGLTIVAIGTSLPELVTSIVASLKKQSDIAVGNVVGSNIFNTFFILGASASINPLYVDKNLSFDIFFNLIISTVLLIFAFRKKDINRLEGFALLFMYISYMLYLIL